MSSDAKRVDIACLVINNLVDSNRYGPGDLQGQGGEIMIYKCMWCGSEIGRNEIEGDKHCYDFMCIECAEEDYKKYKKEILEPLYHHFKLLCSE